MRENWRRRFERGRGMKCARKETLTWKKKRQGIKGDVKKEKRWKEMKRKKCKRHVTYT